MNSVNLMDLHSDVLYEIFELLERKHLYFCVRHVCKAMRKHVDSYMSLTGKFMFCEQSLYTQVLSTDQMIQIPYLYPNF